MLERQNFVSLPLQEMQRPLSPLTLSPTPINRFNHRRPLGRYYTLELGNKQYELTNHLGNVQAVVSDRKLPVLKNGFIAKYQADLLQTQYYYPYGSTLFNYSLKAYSFGYNTQVKDTNIADDVYHARFWEYDAKIALRWNVDPVIKPDRSSYACLSGNPIANQDKNGDSDSIYNKNGEFVRVINNNFWHNTFVGNLHSIQGENNLYALTEQALKLIKSGKFSGLIEDFLTRDDELGFKTRLNDGLKDYSKSHLTKFGYAFTQSKYNRKLDQKVKLDNTKLYVFAEKANNVNEAGNFIWGAAIRVLLHTGELLTAGFAHAGTLYIAKRLDEADEITALKDGNKYISNNTTLLNFFINLTKNENKEPKLLEPGKY